MNSGQLRKSSFPLIVADDFGLSPGINRAIIDLARRKRIQAVSCMTVFPEFDQDISQLRDLGIQIGIHLTLTGQKAYPLSQPPKNCGFIRPDGRFFSSISLGFRTYTQRIHIQKVREEFQSQLRHFRSTLQRDPEHIDSHEHIHQLPHIRQALLELIAAEGLHKTPVRTTADLFAPTPTWRSRLKKNFLRWQGRSFRFFLQQKKYRDISSLCCQLDYSLLPPRAIQECRDLAESHGIWWIVHPGIVDNVLRERDSLTLGRQLEYSFLLA